MRRSICLGLSVLMLAACSSDPIRPDDECNRVALPLSGSGDGPVVTDVALEVQEGEGIVVVATATDPQGTENLRDVVQSIGVFPDAGCEGAPIVVSDDLSGSGIEETFGTAVDASGNPALFAAIAAATHWPVEVQFADADGNRTVGRVSARVIR